jgi:hypothetical protein
MPLMGLATGTRLRSYEVLPLLCKGRMGEVYRFCDAGLKVDVAIKILADRFQMTGSRFYVN